MSIFDRMRTLQALFGAARKDEAASMGRRWRRAVTDEARLLDDVIREGGLLDFHPRVLQDGVATPDVFDPHHLAYAQGRRDMALQLAALMNLTAHDLSQMMRTRDDD